MNTISFNKIKLLISKFFVESWKRETIMWLILFSVAALAGYMSFAPLYIMMASIFLIIGPYFHDLRKSAASRIDLLMVPASTADKVISNGVIAIIRQLVALLVIPMIGANLGRLIHTLIHEDIFTLFSFSDLFYYIPFAVVLMALLLQSTYVFGSVYFKKNPVIKTYLCQTGFVIFLGFLNTVIAMNFLRKTGGSVTTNYIVSNFPNTEFVFYGLLIILTIIFWLLTFFKLRETEV